jgi:predicted PurR-regulated permease PerM
LTALIQLRGLVDAIGRRTAEGGGIAAYATTQADRVIAWAGHYIDLSRFDLQDQLLGRLQSWSGALMGAAGGLLGDLTALLVNGLLVLILMFFVFRDGRAIRDYLARILPLRAHQLERLSDGVGDTIQASMFGILAVALAQAALLGIGFWFLGIEGSVFWAAATIFASLLPIVGAAVIWLPAAVWLLATGSWIKALILVAWGVGAISMIDNILRPYVMSGRVELHPLLLAFAILGGMQAFGMIGLFAGPVILAVTRTLFELLGEEFSALGLSTGQQQE